MKVQSSNVSMSNQSTPFKRGLIYSGIVATALLPSLLGATSPQWAGCLEEQGKAVLRPEGQAQGPVQWYLDRLLLAQPDEKQ